MYKSSFQSSRLVERRYKQMLEEEQKSLARNKSLLEDIDRLEEQIQLFSNERKQDEEKLKQAKNKFMKYVKSVYPKWTEDVKKWREMKKRPHGNIQRNGPDLHSTPNRNFHSHTDFERSPYCSVADGSRYYHGSSEHPRDRIENSKENLSCNKKEMDHSMDRNGSYRNSSEYPKDTVKSFRDIKGYSNDRMRIIWDRDSYRNQSSSRERMTFPRDKPRSFRETTDLSWDEMGFSQRGYPGTDIGYPRMYNGGAWMYPQNTPPGLFSQPGYPYFVPMPAPFGVQQWSTPGYDLWSDSRGRSYENYSKGEKQGFAGNGKECAQNESFVDKHRGDEMEDEVLPRARNVKLYSEDREGHHTNQSPKSRDDEHSPGRSSEENIFNGARFAGGYLNESPAEVTRQIPSVGHDLRRSNKEVDRQQSKESYESDIGVRTLEGKPDKSSYASSTAKGRGDRGRRQRREKEVNERVEMDDQRYLQPKEELSDRTTISEHFDAAVKVNRLSGREYLGEPMRDARLMQLRSEGSGFGNRDAGNTDSVSLPTIHQYEGDPRDIFSDISDSENLDQNDDGGKQGKLEDYCGKQGQLEDFSGAPKQDSTNLIDHEHANAKAGSGISGIQQSSQERHSQERDDSDISNSQPQSENASSRVDKMERDPRELESKLSRGNKVKSSVPGSDRGLLKLEVLESKSSVVEDLIGDDVSDLEVSDAELSDEDVAGVKPLRENLVVGNAKREIGGVAGPEIGGISSGEKDGTKVNNYGTINRNIHGYDISNESAAGAQSEVKNSPLHQSNDQHSAASVSPTKIISKGLSESLEIETGHTKEDVFKANKSDEKISANEGGVNHSSVESISKEVVKTLSDNSKRMSNSKDTENNSKTDNLNMERPRMDSIQDAEDTIDTFKDKGSPNEDQKVTKAESFTGTNQDGYKEKSGENVDQQRDGKIRSEDENSKSGILEEVSFSSEELTFESVPRQGKNESKKSKSKAKDSVSYSEDFEDEKSVPLTQSAAYKKMLSAVDVSDEDEDLERDFLEGTMSEANTTAQSAHDMSQTLQDSAKSSQVKLPAKSSKSKPTLSLFSSGEDEFGNEGAGVLSPSWKSSEGSLSPPLSPATEEYVPSSTVAGKVENKEEERKGEEEKKVSPVDETKDGKVETGKKLQESDTKSRIQAGFWNHSDSESEVDLQISHGGNDNNNDDDDDDFDFYS